MSFPTTAFPGLQIARVDRTGVEELVLDGLEQGRGGWVVTANLSILRQCATDPSLRLLVAGADIVVADGTPLVWASRLARRPVPERIAGSDLIWTLTANAASARRSIYLLGGQPRSAELAAARLAEHASSLRIAGWHCPPYGFEHDPSQMDLLTSQLTSSRPDIVYVGLGFPKQDLIIRQLHDMLPATWFIGVGVSIDFVAGHVRRAPQWTHDLGAEWLFRLSQEPKKLAGRYIANDLPFAWRLFRWALRERRAPS
ncbi:MAG TPA: WecB/TagA/CpsF family glycosyltransferase [Solirubrobacterales bacterium]|nr:WecB/TagA/CpsF family glycosyltransferase [Solirubrobacterales bacterium]